MYQVDRYVDVNTRGTALLLDILVNAKHSRREGDRGLVDWRLRRGRLPLRDARPGGADDPPGGAAGRARLGAALPACAASTSSSVPTPEDKALYRDNIYSMTKYHQEEMVLLIGKTYGIPAVAPRFFNVYGPRQSLSNPYAGVAAIWLSRLLNGKPPVVFEDGGQLRDFVSIHDVVDCLVLMLEKPGADYLPVNVGSGETVTILDIAEAPRPAPRHARSSRRSRRPGRRFDIRHNTADITRARETLWVRAEGLARAGLRRADRVGEDDAGRARSTSSTRRSRSCRTKAAASSRDPRLRRARALPRARSRWWTGPSTRCIAGTSSISVPPRSGSACRCCATSPPTATSARKHPPLLPEDAARGDHRRHPLHRLHAHQPVRHRDRSCGSCGPRYYVKGRDWRGRGLPPEQVRICGEHGIEIVYLDTVLDSSSRLLKRLHAEQQSHR